MRWPFKQRVLWSWKAVFYMDSAFPLIDGGGYVEPTLTWRRVRTVFRVLCVLLALMAALRPLEGTVRALFLMLLELFLVALIYVCGSYYIMNYAPCEPARKDQLPETIAAQKERDYLREQALQGNENFVEDSGYPLVSEGVEEEPRPGPAWERQGEAAEARYQEALAAARALQEELQQSLAKPPRARQEGRLADRDTKELPPLD